MNLAATVEAFAASYTVTRSAVSTFTTGRRTAGSTSTLTIKAVFQPLTGRDLLRLPEGMRTRELLVGFTTTELKTQGASQEPDVVAVASDSYEVQTVERWDVLGAYWKVVVAKIGR